MIHDIGAPPDFIASERPGMARTILSLTVPGAFALALSGLAGAWMLYMRPSAEPNLALTYNFGEGHKRAGAPKAVANPDVASAPVAANPYGELFDPRFSSGSSPVSLAQSFPLKSTFESASSEPAAEIPEPEQVAAAVPSPVGPQFAESAPLPTPRPGELGSPPSHAPLQAPPRHLAQQMRRPDPQAAPQDKRGFFEKLFSPPPQPSGPVLAYAAPETTSIFGNIGRVTSAPSGNPSGRYDRYTAVYDISAHTVYLPNGTRLEAHSGLGDRLDDPRYVHERMRGPTPPHVYELTPREQLFHGVQALRLTPIGGGDIYGRAGLLAHTYMLGPRGDSNGCVSFRNYNAFLQAYHNGEIKRLVVVARQN